MHISRLEGIAPNVPLADASQEGRKAVTPAPQAPASPWQLIGFLLHALGSAARLAAHEFAARRIVAALAGALVAGGLAHGSWTLITWTPLPPQQFAAALQALPAAERDTACTSRAIRQTRGPYDASMLAYAFDAGRGLCVAIETDDFRAKVLAARALHRQLAGMLAFVVGVAAFAWLVHRFEQVRRARLAPVQQRRRA